MRKGITAHTLLGQWISRQKAWLASIVAIFIFTGCVFQTTYNQLDWATVFTIDRYVSLTSAQKKTTEADMVKLLTWHKANEIPKLKKVMETIDSYPSSQITPAQLYGQWEAIESSLWRTYYQLEPYAYTFLTSLDDDQADELLTYLNKKYQKRVDKYKKRSQKDKDKRDLKNFTELVEYWIGDLTDQQTELLKQWVKNTQHNYSQEVAQYMLDTIANFDSVFDKHPDEAAYRQQFSKIYQQAQLGMPASLEQGLLSNKKGKAEVLSQILHTLTPKQEKKYRKRLKEWRDNFTFSPS